MTDTAREMAEGAAKVLCVLRRWEETATTGLDTTNKRKALIDYLDQVCRDLRDIGTGHAELREGREQLARGMADLEQGREKLRADNEALAARMHALEAYSRGLETQKKEMEKTAVIQAEEKARLDEKSKLIQEQMSSVEERLDSLKISMDDSFGSLTRGHGDLVGKFDSLAEDQLRREQEREVGQRRRDEEREESQRQRDEGQRRRDEERDESQRLRDEERKEDQRRRDESQRRRDVERDEGQRQRDEGQRQRDEERKEDQRLIEELREHERRREEARKADEATIASGLSQVNDAVAGLAQEQLAWNKETSARIESFADTWTIERPKLEKDLLKNVKERDNALFNSSVHKFELKQSQERIDKQQKSLEQLTLLHAKVQMLQPKVEELDQVRCMLVEQLEKVGKDVGPVEDLDVVNMIRRMAGKYERRVTERDELSGEVKRLTEQVLELRRDDMDEAKRRADVLDDKRSSVKRKAPGGPSGSSPKRQRQDVMIDWRERVDAISSFMSVNMPIPDPDGTVSRLRAVRLILAAVADESMMQQLGLWLEEAEEGRWYCLDQVVLKAISEDAEIDERGCFRHHSSEKHEDCYQIKKDALERNRIVCRMRQWPE
ncbi:hypothetical protein F4803DRAFT_578038 [Xylaria telfairii]|nr:hypothetical protein F4803DRAFT_578038 [Xylaria telfairii]